MLQSIFRDQPERNILKESSHQEPVAAGSEPPHWDGCAYRTGSCGAAHRIKCGGDDRSRFLHGRRSQL